MVDKADRKRQLAEWKKKQRSDALAAMPLSPEVIRPLFGHLNSELENHPCDHTLRLTTAWLVANDHDPERVVPWLRENGGYCDCEVLANVEDKLEEAEKGEAKPD